jgi:hypothetical protein
LGVDPDQINNLEATFHQLPQEQWYRGIIGHVPPLQARPGKPLKLTATVASEISQGQYGSANSSMHLFYRSSHDRHGTSSRLYDGCGALRTPPLRLPVFPTGRKLQVRRPER